MVLLRERTEIGHYDFHLRTPSGVIPTKIYSFPIFMQDEPEWPLFTQRMKSLQADHFTLVADGGLPESLVTSVYEHLQETGIPCLLVHLDASEHHKTSEAAFSIATQARAAGGGTHQSCFVSLGGGVIGNITGFAATCLVRGVRLVHIPTTLLAATDSILSLKQGVNVRTPDGRLIKNLVGAFYAPEFVLIYLSLWQTLSGQEISSGLNELIKNVVCITPEHFGEVEALLHPDKPLALAERRRIFELCFEAKRKVMQDDAHERGPALVLESGHTFGHALESQTGLAHGLAVGLGMLVAAEISVARGMLAFEELASIRHLLQRNGAPTTLPVDLDVEAILGLVNEDNKIGYLPRLPGFHVMVLLEHLGKPLLEQGLPLTYVADAELRAAITQLQRPQVSGPLETAARFFAQ